MLEHRLVPKHELLSESEADKVLEKYGITGDEMPKIERKDPAIKHLDANEGDIIKITRENKITGKSHYYRVVED